MTQMNWVLRSAKIGGMAFCMTNILGLKGYSANQNPPNKTRTAVKDW
jgi:hypothetical protein